MIKFKRNLKETVFQYKYIILTLVLIFSLGLVGFFYYNQKLKVRPPEEDVQFNFTIDGKNYIMPSVVHSFHFLNSMGFPWQGLTESNPTHDYDNETQRALNLGGRSADGTVLVFADEKIKAIEARGIFLKLADSLEITEQIKDRLFDLDTALIVHADQSVLDERIIHLEYEIEKALHDKKKDHLAVLMELGAWLEGLHIASKGIINNYKPMYAEILRQPHIAQIYLDIMEALIHHAKTEKEKKLLKSISSHLEQAAKIANHSHKESFP
ncbi:MAG TPA: hypothetical protein PLS71_21590, partial [Leptospiraceae bacterium]|nr:hypothetical protein [Leptospiraceae bacterium]